MSDEDFTELIHRFAFVIGGVGLCVLVWAAAVLL